MAIFDDIDYEAPQLSSGALDAAAAEPAKPAKRGFMGGLFNRPGASEALIAFGANMLSAPSFGEGLGRAGMAFVETLKSEEDRRRPKQQFLADGAILANTNPLTGETTFEDVDPVQQHIAQRDEAEIRSRLAIEDAKQEDREALLDARYDRSDAQLAERLAQQDELLNRRLDQQASLMRESQDRMDARAYGLAAYRAALDAKKDGAGESGGRLLDSRNVKEITGKADMADHLDRLSTGFRDEFGGNPTTGGLANFIGKYTGKRVDVDLPGVGKVELADPDQAQWWQDYDDFKGMVRNDRFGATLTNNEKRDFEKITVSPGMAPDTIRRNLDRQRQIVMGALARRMRMAGAGGYNREQILEAAGPAGLKALESVPSVRDRQSSAPARGGSRSVTVPKAHVDYLLKNPGAARDFDAKYGKGAAAAFIRKRQGK